MAVNEECMSYEWFKDIVHTLFPDSSVDTDYDNVTYAYMRQDLIAAWDGNKVIVYEPIHGDSQFGKAYYTRKTAEVGLKNAVPVWQLFN